MILKIVRSVLGGAIVLSSTPLLIQGGLSRYAKYGIPPTPDWRLIILGIGMMTVGITILPRKPRARVGN